MDRFPRPFPLLAAAALLGACQGARPAEPSAPAVSGPVRLAHHHGLHPASPQAVASGVLEVDRQGCLGVGDRVLVWPDQTALDLSQPGVVRVFRRDESVSVRVGEEVAMLVGAPAGAVIPSACPGPHWAVARFAPAG